MNVKTSPRIVINRGVAASPAEESRPKPVTVQAASPPKRMAGAGGAKPVEAHFGQPAFPQPDVLYPLALANQFVGRDLRTSLPDIEMVLSSTMNWDRSTDGSVASTGQSMLSVAVHEMEGGWG